jgi:hypothetical protein
VVFYNRAVQEILEEFTTAFTKIYKKRGLKPKEDRYKKLFLLDGTPVNNLLDITNDVKVLIATDRNDFVGVQFEDV